MTVENISSSTSIKVWDQAGIKLMTSGSAIGSTDCGTRPGINAYV